MRSTETKGRTVEVRKKQTHRQTERGGGERRAKLLRLIFVNICKELKCRDNRQDVLKKKKIHDIQIHVTVS